MSRGRLGLGAQAHGQHHCGQHDQQSAFHGFLLAEDMTNSCSRDGKFNLTFPVYRNKTTQRTGISPKVGERLTVRLHMPTSEGTLRNSTYLCQSQLFLSTVLHKG